MANEETKRPSLRFRAIALVIKASGLVPMAITFAVLYIVASIVVTIVEPSIHNFGDACWLMFQVVTTIGLGDFTCTSVISRAATIILSVYSVFFIALLTGAVVSYCSERMKARRDESVAAFIDKLEHLHELTHEDLVNLSNQVKEFDHRHQR